MAKTAGWVFVAAVFAAVAACVFAACVFAAGGGDGGEPGGSGDRHLNRAPARLVASGNPDDFPVEASAKASGAPLRAVVIAVAATNVAVTGEGEVFGNGWAYDYSRKDQPKPMGLCFYKCRGVRLEGFVLRDTAFWGINLVKSEDVVIRRLKIDSHAGLCTDGIDIEGRNVLIEDCDVDSGDDAYCVKSHDAGYEVENVVVRNCSARSHCNAFKLGTASHGVMRNIAFVHCRAYASRRVYRDLAPMPKDLLDWKCVNVECVDGGLVENVVADDIVMEGFQTPLFVRGGDRSGFNDDYADSSQGKWFAIRNVVFSNVRGRADGRTPSTITGAGRCRPENVVLRDVDLEIPGEGENAKPFSWPGEDKAGAYPQTNMFDPYHLPAYGLFVDKAEVKMENVKFRLRPGTNDARPAVHVNKEG